MPGKPKYNELLSSTFRTSLLVGISIGLFEAALIVFEVLTNNSWSLSLFAGLIRFASFSAGSFFVVLLLISVMSVSLIYAIFKTRLGEINYKVWLLRYCWFIGLSLTFAVWLKHNSVRPLLSTRSLLYDLGAVVVAAVLAEILSRIFVGKIDEVGFMTRRRPSRAILVWLAALILALIPTPGKNESARGNKPNIILLIVDTLRADRLGTYGYEKNTSPSIDKIAKQGAVFEQAYVQWASSLPSHASIMTSLYPHVHGAFPNGRSLDQELLTLPQILKAHGYKNGAFVTNMLVGNEYNFDQGYDTFTDLTKTDYRNSNASMWIQSLNVVRLVDRLMNKDIYTEQALHWIDHNKDRPFFLWLQWLYPHAPYDPPGDFLDRFESSYSGIANGSLAQIGQITTRKLQLSEEDKNHYEALYDGEVAASDHEIGRVIEKLESLGLLENSLLIITSDHGENLYEHEMEYGHYGVYDSSIRIPLIFSAPGFLPENKRIPQVVESIDIAPTILDFLGIEVPKQFQGRSLRPLIQGESVDWNSFALSMMFRDNRNFFAIRSGDWKIILDARSQNQEFQLYHIPSDPNELNNLFATKPQIADSLQKELSNLIEREFGDPELVYAPGAILRKEFDQQTIERLRSLGYIK